MPRRIFTVVLVMLCVPGFIYSQTLEVSGEVKTGLYWSRTESPGKVEEDPKMHNYDDAGSHEGRFRMNMHVKKDIIGMKVRFEKTVWTGPEVQWGFAFAYGDFFDEQLRVVAGKLGESPWSAGGPDIWQELDNQIGIRMEVKPLIVPGLNVGFVFNSYNGSMYSPEKKTLTDMLMESILGIAYTNDYIHVRFSYRLDGEADRWDGEQEGMEMMYRLEEKILQKYVEGLRLWVNGWWRGIGTEKAEDQNKVTRIFWNWFYAQWAHQNFTAELRLGYHPAVKVNELHTAVGFMYNILPWLSAGAAFRFQVDTGDTPVKDVPYKKWNVEPQIKMTFAPSTYVSFVYLFENEPLSVNTNKQTQKINLRTVFTF